MWPGMANNLLPQKVAAAQNITATANLTATDLQYCLDRVSWLIDLTAIAAADASNYATFTIQTSPDNATWTTLPVDDMYITPRNRSTANPQPVTPMPVGTDMYGQGPFVVNLTSMTGLHLFEMQPPVDRYVRLRVVITGTVDLTCTVYAFKHPRNMPRPGTLLTN